MKTKILLLAAVLAFSFQVLTFNCNAQEAVNGQTLKKTATEDADKWLRENNPAYKADRENLEKYIQNWIKEHPNYESKTIIIIPVVVHVLYNNSSAPDCISASQVQSQIDATNTDLAGLNPHSMNAFPSSLKANTNIQLCLAPNDPGGNPTTGIDYKQTTVTSFNITGYPQNCTGYPERCASTGGADAWNVNKYFNVWVCNMGSSGLCGIAEFPGTVSNNNYYGASINYLYFGTNGTATAPFNLGSTLTHELGYSLNLYNMWSSNCSDADSCADTPPQTGICYTCPGVVIDSCSKTSPGILCEDFMQYCDDIYLACYTPDQALRMQAVLAEVDAGLALSSSNCNVFVSEYNEEFKFSIYPNPATDNITIESTQQATIEITNIQGQVIKQQTTNIETTNVDVSALAKGMYFVKVRTEKVVAVKKFIKE